MEGVLAFYKGMVRVVGLGGGVMLSSLHADPVWPCPGCVCDHRSLPLSATRRSMPLFSGRRELLCVSYNGGRINWVSTRPCSIWWRVSVVRTTVHGSGWPSWLFCVYPSPGSAAGFMQSFIASPAELIKVRMQVERGAANPAYEGNRSCARYLVRTARCASCLLFWFSCRPLPVAAVGTRQVWQERPGPRISHHCHA